MLAEPTVLEPLAAWVTWRDLARLVILSALLTLAATTLFRRNATSRRGFATLAALSLLFMPWLSGWVNPLLPVGLPQAQVLLTPSASGPLPWWLVILLCGLSLIGLLRWALQLRRSRLAIAQLPLLRDARLLRAAAPVVKALGLQRCPNFCAASPAQLKTNRLPQAPFASSFRAGLVVLPSNYQSYNEATLQAVLTHELVHIARRDDVWCLLLRLVVSLYWFLPWLRNLERQFLLAMEHSCDDRAADFFGRRCHYMDSVVDTLRGAKPLTVTASAVSASGLPATGTTSTTSTTSSTTTKPHPFVQRVLRFGHHRDFDADAAVVSGYLGITLLASLLFGAITPVAKPIAKIPAGTFSTAGLSLPQKLSRQPEFPAAVSTNRSLQIMPQQTMPIVDASQPVIVGRQHAQVALQPDQQHLPVYPGQALRQQLEGEVWVEYRVAGDGTVLGAQVMHSTPVEVFDRATIRSLRYLRFPSLAQRRQPLSQFPRADQHASTMRVRQRFRYQLQSLP